MVDIIMMGLADTVVVLGTGTGEAGENGNGSCANVMIKNTDASGGGGYYTKGTGFAYNEYDINSIGGLGTLICAFKAEGLNAWFTDTPGSGGKAGTGGDVSYSSSCEIFAYNGDMITDGNYENIKYYDEKGESVGENLAAIQKKNGEKFIPSKIFAQSGILRATYTSNMGAFSLSKVKTGEKVPEICKSYETFKVLKATEESKTTCSGYTNGYIDNQGIGSGAGYLETSNGTFKEITETP